MYAGLGIELSRSISLTTTYTAYTSPNDMFDTVKEISLKLAFDDSTAFGTAALRPYVLAAFELDTGMGMGQADGGLHAGRYLELGVRPSYSVNRISVAFPVRLGLSLSNYYELASEDNRFGFASVAGVVTVPIVKVTNFGTWNVHGGIDVQIFGETTKVFNGGDRHKAIGLIGVGLSN